MTRFIVAMACEARPVIDHYGLKSVADDSPFPVFRRENRWLAVSGIGKANAAAATAFLHLRSGAEQHCGWINFGCCGHSQVPVGQGVLAHKIVDRGSGRSWFPPLAFSYQDLTSSLCTVDRPERNYGEDQAYDMEAAGFFDIACRFTSAELVHCLKVVSDGPGDRLEDLTAAKITDFLTRRMDRLIALVTTNEELAAEVAVSQLDPSNLREMTSRWRFSLAQKRKLHRLLQRWQVLQGAPWEPGQDLKDASSSKEVLRYLERQVHRRAAEKGTSGENKIRGEQELTPGERER